MTHAATPDVRPINLGDLHLSKTTAQIERREHIDKKQITELADSIKTLGVLQPIIVRPGKGNGGFEVVAGERRFLAAKLAKLEQIVCTVRDLTDEQAVEVQLIENLQRQDLHELAEAEGYEALQKLGHTAEAIADKVGKSKATVYARMKLLALCPEARKSFYAGKLSASTALLLARIPVESLQKQALKEITEQRWDGVMSYRSAAEHIHNHYMLRLDQAGFPTADPDLVPAAGPCGSCPKRTGNQPELFGDVKSADVCTDPPCFQAKRAAHAAKLIAAAEAKGQQVITGDAAKKLIPYDVDSEIRGHVKLDAHCYSDRKNRTYRQLLPKDVETTLLQDPKSGKLVQIVKDSTVNEMLGKSGARPVANRYPSHTAADKKRRLENVFRAKLFAAVREKAPAKLGRFELEALATSFFKDVWHEFRKRIVETWGWGPKKGTTYGHDYQKIIEQKVPKLSHKDLNRFLFDLAFCRDLVAQSYDTSKPVKLLAAAKRLRINADKIRKECAPAKKAAKKKARKHK